MTDMIGTGERDLLIGTAGDDTMFGYLGTDTLLGGDGDDWLGFESDDLPGFQQGLYPAENGPDSFDGGAGNDRLFQAWAKRTRCWAATVKTSSICRTVGVSTLQL